MLYRLSYYLHMRPVYISLLTMHISLNDEIMRISNWAEKWKVDFNPAKRTLVTVTNKQNPETQQLVMDGA